MRPARFVFHEARAGNGAGRNEERLGQIMQRIEKTFAGRKLVIETGRMAKQAAGSCLVTYGDTMVLATVPADSSSGKAAPPTARS
jgi:ribonuclease PH